MVSLRVTRLTKSQLNNQKKPEEEYLIYYKHSGSVKRSRNVVFDITSSLYDKDVTVLNKRSIDIIHDIENKYDQVKNNEQIENENNQDIINHDEPIGRPRRQINMPK